MDYHNRAFGFDDVGLVPRLSKIWSRSEPDLSTKIGPLNIGIPLISSPMDTVTEVAMSLHLGELGGLGILHRFSSIEEQVEMCRDLLTMRSAIPGSVFLVPAIGCGKDEMERFRALYDNFKSSLDMIAIDIAYGGSPMMKEMVQFVKSVDSDLPILAGNVATGEGFRFLTELGVNAIRVGVGSGLACKTRIQTGFGMPTLYSVHLCYQELLRSGKSGPSIIADGGIRYPGDVVKSLAFGADAVICGGIFAGTNVSPGSVISDNSGKEWKLYRGAASREIQEERRGGMKPGTCAEGDSRLIPYRGDLNDVVTEFTGGLRSGMSYGNAMIVSELRDVEKVWMTNAGVIESHPFAPR